MATPVVVVNRTLAIVMSSCPCGSRLLGVDYKTDEVVWQQDLPANVVRPLLFDEEGDRVLLVDVAGFVAAHSVDDGT